MSRIQLTRWLVNSMVVPGVLLLSGVTVLYLALHLFRGAECMALIDLGISIQLGCSIQAALYLMQEKRFAELLNGVAGPPVSVSARWQACAGGLLLPGLVRLMV